MKVGVLTAERGSKCFGILFLAVACLSLPYVSAHAMAQAVDGARQQELLHLLRQDCGSCHGMTLKGGLGPALTPQALREKPNAYLRDTIMQGRPEQAMPPWQGILSEAEVSWLVEQMKVGLKDGESK